MRAGVCQAVVITEWEDVEWECEERGGHRWPRRWGRRPLATAREAVGLFAPPLTESRSSTTLRERDKRKKKKVVGSGVVCCRVLSART